VNILELSLTGTALLRYQRSTACVRLASRSAGRYERSSCRERMTDEREWV